MKYAKRLAQRVIEGEAFVVDPKDKAMHSFNAVGSRIWELAGKVPDRMKIAETIAAEFDVTQAQAQRDVDEFLAKLKVMGLLEG